MFRRLFFMVLILLFLFSFAIQAAETDTAKWSFSIQDQLEDDHGPGTYQYPTTEIFASNEGLFDLQQFKVEELKDDYLISFKFGNLTDPWDSKYGFSLPLIQLYIDNQKGGKKELFQKGANVKLDPEHPWDKLFKLTGWWLRVYEPDDKAKIEMDFNEDVEETPWEVKNSKVSVEKNTIKVKINKDVLGELKGAHLFILVGSFDPFGQDHFRGVKKEPSSWSFSAPDHDNLKFAPRVLDTVFPEEYEQEKVLNDFTKDYPTLKPIALESPKSKKDLFILSGKYLFILILLAALALVLNKKDLFRNNK